MHKLKFMSPSTINHRAIKFVDLVQVQLPLAPRARIPLNTLFSEITSALMNVLQDGSLTRLPFSASNAIMAVLNATEPATISALVVQKIISFKMEYACPTASKV